MFAAYRDRPLGASVWDVIKFQSQDNSKNAAGLNTKWPDHATISANSADRPISVTTGVVAATAVYASDFKAEPDAPRCDVTPYLGELWTQGRNRQIRDRQSPSLMR